MALSILDGTQTATTLSTILSSGQHITAHTVVSLGTQAITDMRSAVSGSVVSISNLPSTQTIAGTVTVGVLPDLTVSTDFADVGTAIAAGITNYGSIPVDINSALPAGTNRIGVVTIGAGTVTIGAGTAQIGSVTASISGTVPISISSVTVGNSVTIGSLPALVEGSAQIGTVTVSNISSLPDAGENPVIRTFMFGYDYDNETPIAIASDGNALKISGTVTVGNSVTIESLPAISGTVTANSSNGSLTTRFGSVTTANTAFATSAVTNTNRKYLLIQNITTASNVITVGIGFTPTTTQGIQLFAGAGLTFEGTYIPTGAVNLLSSVTASCYTILEA